VPSVMAGMDMELPSVEYCDSGSRGTFCYELMSQMARTCSERSKTAESPCTGWMTW
jgi:protein tyrosine phosphatase (PTP) superfamily phosphohydrolase (DUF442 family)